MYVIRDGQKNDLPGLRKLASELNTVNLPDDERELSFILDRSARSFDGRIRDPFEREYLFVMEETRTGKNRTAGCVRALPAPFHRIRRST